MYIIGLCGQAHAGKNKVAELLQGHHPFDEYAFADPLKKAAAIIFDLPIEHFYDEILKETINEFWGMTPRQMLLKLGTDACRDNIRDDIWVKRTIGSVEKSISVGNNVVVTDVRFPNEAEEIKRLGGHIVRVIRRDGELAVDHKSAIDIPAHLVDVELFNDGTLALLKSFKVPEVLSLIDDLDNIDPSFRWC